MIDTPRAVSLRNSEQRRCAAEMLAGRAGWRQVVSEAGWPRVGQEAPDPGNPGDRAARPSLERVLLRADRIATVRLVIADLTDGMLAAMTEPVTVPGFPNAAANRSSVNTPACSSRALIAIVA